MVIFSGTRRFWSSVVVVTKGPHRLYKLLVFLAIFPKLISTSVGSRPLLSSSTEASYDFKDSQNEVTSTVEYQQVVSRLESGFLKLLEMEARPKSKSKSFKIPKYLIDLYNAQTGSDLGTSNLNLPGRFTKTANTVRTFYHNPSSEVKWGDRVKYDIASIPEKEDLTGAELRLVFSNRERDLIRSVSSYPKVRVLVNDVIKPPIKTKFTLATGETPEPIIRPIDSKFIDLTKRPQNDTFWLNFDVFPAVSRWRTNPKKNFGLLIQVLRPDGEVIHEKATSKHIRVRRSTKLDPERESEEFPVLFTYSDDGKQRKQRDAKTLSRHYREAVSSGERKKRNRRQGKGRKRGKHKNKNRKRNLCSRHKMFVDFTDVGWTEWILAPPGYQAYYCAGECPFPMADHLNATNHAVIQALVNSMNPQLVPPPCCVPTKYSSLSLLYTDSLDKIVLKNYNEMVVDACGCS